MLPWYIPACSEVVMDTPRHIRHPISGGMLSASEGLAPNPQSPFSTPSPKMNSVLILPVNRLNLKKGSLLVKRGGLEESRSYFFAVASFAPHWNGSLWAFKDDGMMTSKP